MTDRLSASKHQRHSGSANVSIVDTKTNKVIGSALKSWTSNYLKVDNIHEVGHQSSVPRLVTWS